MTGWLRAGSSAFLRDRMLLYEVDAVCRRYPGAGTPTTWLGLNNYFSDSVCAMVDIGIASYGEWVDLRKKARRKSGKNKIEPLYKTLGELLGVDEEERRGGLSGGDLRQQSRSYLDAVIQANLRGEPPPPPDEFLTDTSVGG